MVEDELYLITLFIPDIRWIRFVRVDGIHHPAYIYDAPDYRRDNIYDQEDYRKPAMSAAAVSMSERISQDLVLGSPRTVVLDGTSATYFLLPVGDGNEWKIAFVVNGHPPVDRTIKYFQDRQYLETLVPFLEAK
ncbi:MAG: hypothetical protein H0X30_38320 [Anaerolineae bacterium]|nr:hypothetical protein [Anaerolineae bacterium]